jgi:tripartite-type tricarboxylate transporter receptor subunit TctC
MTGLTQMKQRFTLLLAALFAVLGGAVLTGTVRADTLEGRTVTVLVPSTPGGGYDIYARMIARHIGRHLPGRPNVIVKNMPGAGGVVMASYLATVAPKDGTELGVFPDSILFMELTNGKKMQLDARRFGWLGAVDKFVPILLAWSTSPYKTFADTRAGNMSVGSISGGSWDDYPKILNAVFGTKLRIVSGYPGSAQITLAIERGEIDGLAAWCWECLKAQKPDWVRDGKARVLLQMSLEGAPELDRQKVPTLADIATTEEQRAIIRLVFGGVTMARPFGTAPGVPAERLATLRKAMMAVVNDKELVAEAEKAGNPVIFTPPERIDKILTDAYATDPAVVTKVQALLGNR